MKEDDMRFQFIASTVILKLIANVMNSNGGSIHCIHYTTRMSQLDWKFILTLKLNDKNRSRIFNLQFLQLQRLQLVCNHFFYFSYDPCHFIHLDRGYRKTISWSWLYRAVFTNAVIHNVIHKLGHWLFIRMHYWRGRNNFHTYLQKKT